MSHKIIKMFKKSVTEEDFKSALQVLERRLQFMEEKNDMLEQDNRVLKEKIIILETQHCFLSQVLTTKISELEKRITDFTDVWHPMMMENVNRIKSELVDEVAGKSEDLLQKFTAGFKVPNDLCGHFLVGLSDCEPYTPCFVSKTAKYDDLWFSLRKCRVTLFFLESIEFFQIKAFDITSFSNFFISLNGKVIREPLNSNQGQFWQYFTQNLGHPETTKGIKTIYNFCMERGIKFVCNGQENINGVPMKLIMEQIN